MGRRQDILQMLERRDLKLPKPVPPKFLYVPVLVTGGLAFVSGQIPLVDGRLSATGRCGDQIDTAEGSKLAELAILHALAELDREVGLDAVASMARLTVYVASADGFTDQPVVANGASQVLLDAFGDDGKHARSAVGVAWLPLNAPVEVELTAVLADEWARE